MYCQNKSLCCKSNIFPLSFREQLHQFKFVQLVGVKERAHALLLRTDFFIVAVKCLYNKYKSKLWLGLVRPIKSE